MKESGSRTGPTQDIQQPQPSEPKDTFVTSIMPIEAMAMAMMNTGCR